jgi:hypothetical protein
MEQYEYFEDDRTFNRIKAKMDLEDLKEMGMYRHLFDDVFGWSTDWEVPFVQVERGTKALRYRHKELPVQPNPKYKGMFPGQPFFEYKEVGVSLFFLY